MKRTVRKQSEADALRAFPIADKLHGWFFRLVEISPGVYRAEGTDLWGRIVSQTGTEEKPVLAQCVGAAKRIQAQVDAQS